MRTTVTLDPDVDAMLKRFMADRGVTFKEAVNTAIRSGLGGRPHVPAFPTFRLGKASFDIDRALHLAGQLEDEELIRKMERRK